MYCILLLVSVATQYAPAHCTRDAATQLQPIPYACGAQKALLAIAVGAMNNNELMNTSNVRESVTIFSRPYKLTFDVLTLKAVPGHIVTRANFVSIFVFLGLSVLELFPMYATYVRRQASDRCQTGVRQKHRLMSPPSGRGHNNQNYC